MQGMEILFFPCKFFGCTYAFWKLHPTLEPALFWDLGGARRAVPPLREK